MAGNKKTLAILLFFIVLMVCLWLTIQLRLNIFSKPGTDNSNKNNTISSQQNISASLQSNKIMIDPGHGGIDSGAERGDIIESKVTLDISKKLKKYLEDKLYIVEMTRSTDISLYKQSKFDGTIQRRELNARVNKIDESGSVLFVSIHINSYPEYPGMTGSIVFYNPSVPQSKELSKCIQTQLNDIQTDDIKRIKHIPQEADFYLLTNSKTMGVLIEMAYITNKQERKLLSLDNFRSQLAKAVADGIENYVRLNNQ